MDISRRRFVQLGGAAAAASAVPVLTDAPGLQERPPLKWSAKTAADMPEPDLAALLLNRASFGALPGEVERARQIGAYQWIEEQLDYDSIDDSDVEDRLMRELPTLSMSSREIWTNYQQMNQGQIFQELALATIYRMIYSKRQLYQVMVEFWTDHFSMDFQANLCRYFKTADDREVIRPHALGNFKDLLTASAMSPCMGEYLDNAISTKARPNENYAREIMELHSLGAADADGYPYSEQDIQEVSRCFTGWSYDRNRNSPTWGEFEFHADDHDNGVKEVLGNFIPNNWKQDGDMVIDILCNHEATGPFLAMKMVRRFVTDDPLGETPELVQRVSQAYYNSNFDIKEMVYTVLTSQEFANSFATYGGRLSRPMDFIARAFRVAEVPSASFPLTNNRALYNRISYALQSMGHVPFYWPTPDGYPDEKLDWSSSIGILTRWNVGLSLCGVGASGANPLGAQMVPNFLPHEQMPADVNTAGAAVDFWVDRLLHRDVLAEDRALLIEYLTMGGSESTPIGEAEASRLPSTMALILDSPYFQWR